MYEIKSILRRPHRFPSPLIPNQAARGIQNSGFFESRKMRGFVRLQGHLRQVITIIPSHKLVILRMGLTREDIGFSNAKLLYAIVAAGF